MHLFLKTDIESGKIGTDVQKVKSMTIRQTLAALAGKMRKLTAGRSDSPAVQVEDYELEHLILYNGLTGSTPENQLDYKDVRNEIVQAINDGSAHQLAIALKLPPLLWEDRLAKVFSEIASVNRDGAVNCLAAQRAAYATTDDTTCLSHSDWRVRSNAALMLSRLKAIEVVPTLAERLDQSGTMKSPDFCHIAYSLARLGSDSARRALAAHLYDSEPWFCVDAAGALSHFDLSLVCADLMKAMLAGNILDDYMAVAICRRHSAADFAQFRDEDIQEGACELVLALLKGISGVFHSESSLLEPLEEIQDRINDLARLKPTPRRLAAAIALNNWRDTLLPDRTADGKTPIVCDLSDSRSYECIKNTLAQPIMETPEQSGQFKHALALAGGFKLKELSPLLVPLLQPGFWALPELLGCLAALGDLTAAPRIVCLVKETIDLQKRCSLPPEANPVFESDRKAADIYWAALKALGSLPDRAVLGILSQAVNDFAPDKREQALLSLQTVLLAGDLKENHYAGNLEELIRKRLADPAVCVQAAALEGVGQHRLSKLLPDVLKALQARERSIQERAADTLVSLAGSGYGKVVEQSLEAGISKEQAADRVARLKKVLQRIVRLSQ